MTEDKDIRFKISYALEEAEKIVQEYEKKFIFETSFVNHYEERHVDLVISVAKMIASELNRKENKQLREEADKNFEKSFKEFNEELFRKLNRNPKFKKDITFKVMERRKDKDPKDPRGHNVGDMCPFCYETITSKDHYCNYG